MRAILKQTSWLVLAQILTRVIGFFYTIFLANALGVLNFGLYSVGLAYFSLISSISDFGFNRFLIREVAKEKSKSGELICNILMLRLTLLAILFALFSIILYSLDSDKMRVSIILVSTLAVFPQVIGITFDGIFVALRKLQFSAVAYLLSSISTALLGIMLINWGFSIFGAVSAVVFGQLIFATSLVILLYKDIGIKLFQIQLKVMKAALWGSLPYGILAILGLLYFRIDTILLSYMRGNFETGIYAVGYRFLESVVFIPNALSFALFPSFVKLHLEKPFKIRQLIVKSTILMWSLGSLIAVAFYFILPTIIKIFLPNYLPSVTVIKILALAIPFMFIHIPAATVLLSTEKYLRQIIFLSLVPILFNIISNLIFIPQFGFVAAAWITVLSDILSVIILFMFINKLLFKND